MVTTTRPGVEARVGRGWPLVALATVPFVLLRAGTLAESDTFWATRLGLLILHDHAIPRVDPFSWTMLGQPLTLSSWGFDAAVGAAYRVGGLATVALMCAALALVVVLLVLRTSRQLGASAFGAALVLVPVLALLTEFLSARPQLVDYAVVLVVAELLRRVVAGHASTRSTLLLGAVSVLWVNLHAAALLGIGIGAATTVLVMAGSETRRRGPACAAATAALALGSLVNPYGLGVLHQAITAQSGSSSVIIEWRHLDPSNPLQLVSFCLGLIAVWVAFRRREVVSAAAIAVALAGSISAMRMLPIALVLAAPVLSLAASTGPVAEYVLSRRRLLERGAGLLVGALALLAAASIGHLGRPDPTSYPSTVWRSIPPGCHVVNTFTQGGFLVLKRPDLRISIDSYHYDAPSILANARLLSAQGDVDRGLAGADCALIPPHSSLARRLGGDPGWRLVGSEPTAALFVRR